MLGGLCADFRYKSLRTAQGSSPQPSGVPGPRIAGGGPRQNVSQEKPYEVKAFRATDFRDRGSFWAVITASTIAPNGAWVSGLAGDSSTKWIAMNANGAGEGSTALYAINFALAKPSVRPRSTCIMQWTTGSAGAKPGCLLERHADSATPPAGTSTPNSPSIATTSRRYCTSAPIRSILMRRTRAGLVGLLFRATIQSVIQRIGVDGTGFQLGSAAETVSKKQGAAGQPAVALALSIDNGLQL